MKLKNMSKQELEVLSYTDLTEIILKENKKSMNTASIFKTICELLELSEDEYASKIGDYYTSLTTDKRFTLLENAEWDIEEENTEKIRTIILDERLRQELESLAKEEQAVASLELVNDDEIEDEEESYEEETEEDENEDLEEVEDESIEITDDEIDLDDDMEDLSIVSDEEMEEEM